ncbi:hypothetical protein ACTA71_002598 [Dictyostelium dimigraforme]
MTRGTAFYRVSKINLVDLAYSERANSTGVLLREGYLCNSTSRKAVFVPYRDTVLTFVLKETLGDNSKTNFDCSNFTKNHYQLCFVDSIKKIKTLGVVNEDAQSKLIREIPGGVERLGAMMEQGGQYHTNDSKLMNPTSY